MTDAAQLRSHADHAMRQLPWNDFLARRLTRTAAPGAPSYA
jgi:hypothetical protein